MTEATKDQTGQPDFEIVIIGAGPAGLGAATNAAKKGLSHLLLERGEVGNTIYDYQLGKLVMAEPTKLPLRALVEFKQGSREEILGWWNDALTTHKVNLRKGEVRAISKEGELFKVSCGDFAVTTRNVVLASGVQGTPRKLGVAGDDLPHIAYTLADPGAFSGKDIIIVGAGDAAIENALGLMEKNRVTLLNRGAEFPRAKEANIQKISDAFKAGKLRVLYSAAVSRVEPKSTFITTQDGEISVPTDHIIARLGCILPRKFLEDSGIKFSSQEPSAVPVVTSRYESNVPGLFILGALIGYPLIKQAINQGFEVVEHITGNPIEPADQVLVKEKLSALDGEVNQNLEMIRNALPFFSECSDSQFRELIIDSDLHLMKPGQVVFEINDYTDSFWSLVKGSVEVLVAGKSPIKISQGEFFGEMGLLSGRRRSATVKVAEDSILLESPRKQILKLNNSVPAIKRQLDNVFTWRALQTSIFPDADPIFLKDLSERSKLLKFKKGAVLFQEGELGDKLYVIRKGSVKVSRKNSFGDDVAQTYIAAGNLVGEMALISEQPKPRSATVSAAVPVEAIAIEKVDFQDLLDKNTATKERITNLVRAREAHNVTVAQNEYLGEILDFAMSEGVTDADNILVIDSDLCVGCDNCEHACAATHGGTSRLDRKGGKTLAALQIPISCRHCENPLCMLDCPPDALIRRSDGEVVIQDSCIGCGNCVRNCPYGVIQLVHEHEDSGFSLLSLLGIGKKKEASHDGPAKAAKCDMCNELAGGPACVRSCPTGAALRVNPKRMLEIFSSKREVVR